MTAGLKHRTIAAAIADKLRGDILDGTYPAGAQLRQDALAASFSVSRIPVREALFQLEAEGLVQIAPHKGAVVTDLSLEEINDVFDLRAILEPRLLAASGRRLSDDDVQAIEAAHAAFAAAVEAREVRRWGELNASFHMALYVRSGQPRTMAIVAGLLQTSDRYTRIQLSTPAAMQRAVQQHRTIIDLTRGGRLREAGAFLKTHSEAVRTDLVALIETRLRKPDEAPAPRLRRSSS